MSSRAVARGRALAKESQQRWAEKWAGDPTFQQKTRAHARSMATPESCAEGGRAAAEKRRADPEADRAYRAARAETGHAVSKLRRVCSCGLESNPGAVARHQKATGHPPR